MTTRRYTTPEGLFVFVQVEELKAAGPHLVSEDDGRRARYIEAVDGMGRAKILKSLDNYAGMVLPASAEPEIRARAVKPKRQLSHRARA